MEELTLQFFPYPHFLNGKRRAGALVAWPEACLKCDQQCRGTRTLGEVQLCSYGYNFLRVDEDFVVAGIVLSEWPLSNTPARIKARRLAGREVVHGDDLERVLERARAATEDMELEFRRQRDELIAAYKESEGYQSEILDRLRPEMQRALAKVHDYKQFVKQIVQNMNVLLAERYGGLELDPQLDVATHEERAIYWAARLMEEKLDAALFVEYPERIHALKEIRRFRFHGMVTKYRKIYQRDFEERHLKLRLSGGESRGDIEANPKAVSIIPHSLIDNAIKYAPEGTEIALDVEETDAIVQLRVGSFGPRIHDDERESIFDPFVRGRDAIAQQTEGTGFGLAAAQTIAKAIGSEIRMTQAAAPVAGCYWTEFSVEFRLAPEGDMATQRRTRDRSPRKR